MSQLAIVAGEASGDWIASLVLQGVQQSLGSNALSVQDVEGIAGPKLLQTGMTALHSTDELAVRGYVEVLKHYRRLVGVRNGLRDRWLTAPPKVMMGVDAPDFNLGLEKALRSDKTKTVHLVCPSIWAWRAERIHTLKQACDHILCVFPFEPAILKQAGIESTYIGHPLASLIPLSVDTQAYRNKLALDNKLEGQGTVIAVLPGSRGAEIQYIGPSFIHTVAQLMRKHPQWRFVSPLVSGPVGETFRRMVPEHMLNRWLLLDGQSHEAMACSDAVLVASGTATMEAALLKKPMVIAYKMPRLSWWLMKNRSYLPYVGLPNILARDFWAPEYFQDDANPDTLSRAVENLFINDARRQSFVNRFTDIHQELIRDTGRLASQVLVPMLEGQ